MSYRPISNLSVTSKLLERVVSKLLERVVSKQRVQACHSMETAVFNVLADILLALDFGDLAMLTLLDLNAAFDSVDHDTLLRRLQISY